MTRDPDKPNSTHSNHNTFFKSRTSYNVQKSSETHPSADCIPLFLINSFSVKSLMSEIRALLLLSHEFDILLVTT